MCGPAARTIAYVRATTCGVQSVEPIILSVDESAEVSIRDVAEMVADAMGLDQGQIKYDATKSDGQYKKTADNTKLRKLLPDFKFVPIAEGIKRSAEWFEQNYDAARK